MYGSPNLIIWLCLLDLSIWKEVPKSCERLRVRLCNNFVMRVDSSLVFIENIVVSLFNKTPRLRDFLREREPEDIQIYELCCRGKL